MNQKTFLFSFALVFVFSVCSQPRQAMAQTTAGGPVVVIFGPTGVGGNQKLEGLFLSDSMHSDYMKLVLTIIKPFAGDEPCGLEVPVEVPIKPGEISAIKIERSGGELWVNGVNTAALPECLIGGRVIVTGKLPIPPEYSDYLSDPSKRGNLTNKLGLGNLKKVITSVLDENDNTETTTEEGKLDWYPTLLSLHAIH